MERFASKHDIPSDFTSQISVLKLGDPCTSGSFGAVYRCTINTSEGTKDVAVKVLNVNPGRAVEKCKKAMDRELKVWLRLLNHQTIVPLLGIADVGLPLPVLVSQWIPSGTLHMYLEQGTITASAKVELVMGVANGLKYLHSEDVVHGDLHPANVLIDDAGNPLLTDFGLATVVGDPELQWGSTTASSHFNPRWRAPEVLGIKGDPELPTFESDIYSFGGVMFFIISGDTPWKEKKSPHQIIIELSNGATPARPNNIPDAYWNLIQQCWSWKPRDRPKAMNVIGSLATTTTAISVKTKSTMSDSATRSIRPKAAASDTTSHSDNTELPDQHPPRRKTVVIFGEVGAGKSSLVNLIAGQEVATTSPGANRCTLQWQDYIIDFDGDSYMVFDTIGLEEPQLGFRNYLEFVEDIYRLIKKLDGIGGIDLLLFCMWAGRVTATTWNSYRLLHEFISEKKIPIVLAITCLEREQRMEDWWVRNHSCFEKNGIQVAGHACITTADRLDNRHQALYNESRITVRNLVKQFTADGQKQTWIGRDNLFVSSMRKLNEFPIVSLLVRKKDLVLRLTERFGLSPDVAKQLANIINQDIVDL